MKKIDTEGFLISEKNNYTKNVNISPCTYLKKEEFINMIQNLNFTHIESADIKFITAFKYDFSGDTVEPKGFDMRID